MERMLMVSECQHCECCTMEEANPSCSVRYAYWSECEEGRNFDCPHFTGVTESQARASEDAETQYWVRCADE